MYTRATGRAVAPAKKVTAPDVRSRKLGAHGAGPPRVPLVMVTAYDFTMARLVDEAGVDIVLVGDSLGMVVQGLTNTLPVTLAEVCYHGRAVARGLSRAHLVGDMPFMSYQASPAQAVESAGMLLKEGAFEAVKLEGGVDMAEHVRRIVRAGVPVMGHVGLTPQSVHALGGFKVQGRGDDAAEQLVADARALEEAGAYSIVLEAIPPDVAARITAAVGVPTIGIGAGGACDGQVLVCTDLLGMARDHAPRFAKRYAELGDAIVDSVRRYAGEVRSGVFPGPEHAYKPNRTDQEFESSGPIAEAAAASDPAALRH
ncbi:MAG TPA: 3-methyl-2-oxobutanoate hydroxymethyltransferase [Polyangiaceae bacterium]|nr:3-methyl-2-oxobutanoate hydroxymethyltransferase [Polyangiaceae bacterium]